ncbi:MAG: sugar ABC transporter permease [Acetobacteraceae bacterium]|nr:sugar ABC transporter permease [Acetobacteraceae bacterium]
MSRRGRNVTTTLAAPHPSIRLPSKSARRFHADRLFAPLAALLTALVMLVVFGVPLVFSLWLSFRGWTSDEGPFASRFIGLENYVDLLTDDRFVSSMLLSLCYTAGTVAAELLSGLAIALLLNTDVPGIALFRTILTVPMMMTPIVAALCWKLLFDPAHGVINALLGTNIVWLGAPAPAIAAVSFVNVWQSAPYVAVLLLAGLRSLPREPLEAAAIDGGSSWQIFRFVVLPMLRPFVVVALLLRTIFEFRAFENVYVLTGGGPADSTMLISLYTYTTSFLSFDLGLGAASSWMMLLVSLLLCASFILVLRRRGAA